MLISAAAAYVAACTMMLYVRCRIRNKRRRITYGPIEQSDKNRIDYLNNKIWKNDTTCIATIRLQRAPFFRLCQVLRERSLLRDTIHVCVEEQVAMFLNTVGHNLRNRMVGTNFSRSGETVSRYFGHVLHVVGELRNDLIRPPSLETPTKIAGNPRWDPYFKDCIGAIDGTHIRASVSKSMEAAFRAHDATILADVIERENGLRVPEGKFYLVDAGYGAKPGFMPPFRGVRYHLNEWGNNPVQDGNELFNLRHSSLRAMDFDHHGDSTEGNNMGGSAGVVWTNAMSAFVLTYLSNLVATGTRTSTGFKQSHLNGCAKELNEYMKVHVSGIQVSNHLRKWKKIWAKINKLKNLSAALWDEGTSTIRLEHEHYTGHIKDHPKDTGFLNTLLEHYHEMATIFGNSMATGQYAKGANDPLATNVIEVEEEAPTDEHMGVEDVTASGCGGGESSASKPPKKRAKISADDDMLYVMTTGIDRLAQAIEKTNSSDTIIPEDLWDNMMDLPGFDEAHLAHYYAYLCENVALARAFNKLSISNKLVWVTRYITRENL